MWPDKTVNPGGIPPRDPAAEPEPETCEVCGGEMGKSVEEWVYASDGRLWHADCYEQEQAEPPVSGERWTGPGC